MAEILVSGFRCDRCGHEWVPDRTKLAIPKVCPSCKTKSWNQGAVGPEPARHQEPETNPSGEAESRENDDTKPTRRTKHTTKHR